MHVVVLGQTLHPLLWPFHGLFDARPWHMAGLHPDIHVVAPADCRRSNVAGLGNGYGLAMVAILPKEWRSCAKGQTGHGGPSSILGTGSAIGLNVTTD